MANKAQTVGGVPSFKFATDSEHGVIVAHNFDEAKEMLQDMLVEADGGWGWVEDADGVRFEIQT